MTARTYACIATALLFAGPTFAQAPNPAPNLYEVKAGIFEVSTMGGISKSVVYFDDFGRKKATYGTTSIATIVKHSLDIHLPDGTAYDINLDEKIGTRMKIRIPSIPPEGDG